MESKSFSKYPPPPRSARTFRLTLGLTFILFASLSTGPALLAQASTPLYTLNPAKADLDDAGYTVQNIAEQFAIYLDSELLALNPERLALDVPGGTSLEALRSRWTQVDEDHFSWYGILDAEADSRSSRNEAEATLRNGYVLLSYTEGRVMGTLQTPEGVHYHITPAAGGIHRLVRTEGAQHDGCGVEAVQQQTAPLIAAEKADACNVPATNYRLDVLALYMPDFVGPQEQAALDSINLDIAMANTIFANSQVKITYNLVYAGPLTEEHPTSSGQLTASQARNWMWNLNNRRPEVERLRADHGADMVSLMIPPNPNNNCGIAFLPHLNGSGQEVLQGTATLFTDQTYMAYEQGCGFADHTYAHEFGHTLGLQHDRGDPFASSTPVKPYAYGYVFERLGTSGQVLHRGASVMGCTSNGTVGGVCSRIPYFSNPDLSPSPYNVAIGEDTNAANGGSFNACVANGRASTYAGLRTGNGNAVPSVQITSPTANATVRINTPFTLAASASDPENGNLGASVQWRSDVQNTLGTGTPISVQLTTLGDHLLTATVQDSGGKKAQHTIRVTVVENDPPRLFVDRPTHQQVVSGNFFAHGWATDASGVASMTFKVDTTPVTLGGFVYGTHRADVCNAHSDLNDPNCPYVGWSGTLNTNAFTNGWHYFYATATDVHGSSKVFSRRFYINNITSASFPVISDAWVYQPLPTRNYGASTSITVRSASSGLGASGYLKFTVSGVTRPVQSAKVRIRTGTKAFPSSRLYWIVDTSWSENTITWNNAPLYFYTQYATGALPASTWVEFDVSSIVTGNGTYTIGLTAADTVGLWYYSRESSYVPSLEITY